MLLRLAFFGTPEFAVPGLRALCAAGRAPLLVVSQPDRPAGRGKSLRRPPVADVAAAAGLPIAQPSRVRDAAFLEQVAALELDVAVVIAFGQIFPPALLELPRFGCLNVHASLLPRYRGAAPIQAALRSLDPVAGVCTMLMEEGLDSGPVVGRAETALSGRETAGELSARLSFLGASLLLASLDDLVARGRFQAEAQDDSMASYAPRLTKADGIIDWAQSATQVDAGVRSMTPWPGAQTTLAGKPLKVLSTLPLDDQEGEAGTVLSTADGQLVIGCGEGAVALLEGQRPGKPPRSARDLVNGERIAAGDRFV